MKILQEQNKEIKDAAIIFEKGDSQDMIDINPMTDDDE